ncbi:MAG: hypothetical protein ABIF19_10090 [Planctomycetota bacterium]
MNKPRILTLIWIFCAAAILAVSFPLGRVKADHCHPTQGQAAAPEVKQPPARSRLSRAPRPHVKAALPGGTTSSKNEPSNVKSQPAVAGSASIEEIYSLRLPQAILTIGDAVKAIESGDKNTELAELSKAVNMLVEIREALGKHIRPQLANSRCPIMGSAINAGTIAANLTRDYNGQKVGFCCGGCPTTWDNLADAQKQAKLSAAKS